ncbi:MAG: EVE domain-containing protein [SAR202 cluster bacterium]|nr:EVE domain-containing protein [SAR202 cluster bacterium]
MPRNFWMVVCNPENFSITRQMGFTVQGLKAQHRRKVQRVEAGDRLLYYVSGIRCFTATATLTSGYFEEETQIWRNEGNSTWPYRMRIKPEIVLDEGQYIDANMLAHRLDYVRRWPPENWYMAFQGNLHLLPKRDFFLIEEEMKKLKLGREYRGEVFPEDEG